MTKKPTSLSDVMAKKATATAQPPDQAEGRIKTLTLRLPPVVHDQLREMAFDMRQSQHALCMEALNLLFERHQLPPIALLRRSFMQSCRYECMVSLPSGNRAGRRIGVERDHARLASALVREHPRPRA